MSDLVLCTEIQGRYKIIRYIARLLLFVDSNANIIPFMTAMTISKLNIFVIRSYFFLPPLATFRKTGEREWCGGPSDPRSNFELEQRLLRALPQSQKSHSGQVS